ncbi:MAG: toll/interleukin-1 receptor domain-containing protein [Hydrogenophilaceae bacterium]|jgi:hypothetical protein|nr:toll/interleukin-1 receptor domain-containing protein [Hydrogenophilaceae bacterium]
MAERYRAFLSYRSSDKALASRIFDRLERWRTPRGLVGQAGRFGPIPPRAGPICRDREEFPTAAYVDTVIAEKIAASRHLIVLCTPAAAEADSWVAREIELFRKLRPSGEIHAIIGAGAPPDCFPAPLLRRDAQGRLQAPLAADLRKEGDGRERAIVKLIAGLIGAEFDLLWRREQRRRARTLAAWAAALAALGAGGFLFVQLQERRIETRERQIEALQPEVQEANFRRFFEAAMRKDLDAAGVNDGRIDYRIVLSADLNGDGRLDFLVYNSSTNVCGSGGCYIEIYLSAGEAYIPAGSMFAATNVRTLNERSSGHLGLVGERWSNLSGHPLHHVYAYDAEAGMYGEAGYWYCEGFNFEGCANPLRFEPLAPEAESGLSVRPGAQWIDVPARPPREAAAVARPTPEAPMLIGVDRDADLYVALTGRSVSGGVLDETFGFVSGADVVAAAP